MAREQEKKKHTWQMGKRHITSEEEGGTFVTD
jgi:hypothetical protein